jgi:NDP-sugar pyrophosphorylase family protein
MQAILLAGGEGTRLRPYTTILPKPLLPVGDRPVLERLLCQLRDAGIVELIICVGYLAPLIQAYFGDGAKWGVQIRYSQEATPLGTAGPIGIIPDLSDHFVVANGDILTDLSFRELVDFHHQQQALVTVATYPKEVHLPLGVLEVSDDDHVVAYTEKPRLHYWISTGNYVMQRRVLQYVQPGQRLDLPDLIRAIIAHGEAVRGYRVRGSWLDMGTPEDYQRAEELYAGGTA